MGFECDKLESWQDAQSGSNIFNGLWLFPAETNWEPRLVADICESQSLFHRFDHSILEISVFFGFVCEKLCAILQVQSAWRDMKDELHTEILLRGVFGALTEPAMAATPHP